MVNPISVALRGKGAFKLAQRAGSILKSYGVTPARLDQALGQFADILEQFACNATFPITTVALARNPQVIQKYQARGIEFAIHGYRHVDHCQIAPAQQMAEMALAKRLFEKAGIQARGFRGPYLHANAETLNALRRLGLAYDSSPGLYWDIVDGHETPAYNHVLGFYSALPVASYPSLPHLHDDLVSIPYSLPDDEALVHRLALDSTERMSALWVSLLHRSHQLGELFTLGLHPERTLACQVPLTTVLARARQLEPPVWIARLDQISDWWRARRQAETEITALAEDRYRVTVKGPAGTAVLVRNLETEAVSTPWANGYRLVQATTCIVRSPVRPCIGLSPAASPDLAEFVRQQGYIAENGQAGQAYALYLEQSEFTAQDRRPLLAQMANSKSPLVRLGRWPNGAQSALSITGDIDALTLWDYALRFLGR
ncbi:MAG: polysaccharide deacetylase family protein [Chloroflexota bacterium]